MRKYSREPKILLEQLLSNTMIQEECKLWQGSKTKQGYGQLSLGDKHWKAHILVYTLTKGAVQKGLAVRHTCDTPSCINPDHLLLGTYKENEADKWSKGRGARHNAPIKITDTQIQEILTLLKIYPQRKVARMYGVSQAYVSMLNTKKRRLSNS